MLRFVDVSNNNKGVDFAKVKAAGAVGVYLKVTEGTDFVDPDYVANRRAAKAAGLRVGGYHFGHPKNSPLQELEFFLSHLILDRGDLLPALDLEVTDGERAVVVHTFGAKFLAGLEKHIGERPVLYSGESFMRENVLDVLPARHWVADYGARPEKYDAWQFTDGQAKYGPAIAGLDTSYVPVLNLLVFQPGRVKRVASHVKKGYVVFSGLLVRRGSALYQQCRAIFKAARRQL